LNLHENFWCNEIWHCKYAILFGLTRCVVHSLWLLLSGVGGLAESDITVMHAVSHLHGLIIVAIHLAADIHVVPSVTALDFVTKMTQTYKSTVPNAIQEEKIVKYNQY